MKSGGDHRGSDSWRGGGGISFVCMRYICGCGAKGVVRR